MGSVWQISIHIKTVLFALDPKSVFHSIAHRFLPWCRLNSANGSVVAFQFYFNKYRLLEDLRVKQPH